MNYKTIRIFFLLHLLFCSAAFSQTGLNDATFNSQDQGFGNGTNRPVNAILPLSTGKALIAGDFTRYKGVERGRIVRINANESIDLTFNSAQGADGAIVEMLLQNDGRIIIAGTFTSYNGIARNNIARLNPDGSLDATFDPGSGANGTVLALALQSDGKIIIGGDFTAYSETNCNRITRINADGSVDIDFNIGTGVNNSVKTLCIQSDGKIIAAGNFAFYNQQIARGIARINTDGSRDTSFLTTNNSGTNNVDVVALQADGKILCGGSFLNFNNDYYYRGLVRLESNGTIDTTLDCGGRYLNNVHDIDIQSDGKIIISGDNFYQLGQSGVSDIFRLNTYGNLDPSFIGTAYDVGYMNAVAIKPNGKILAAGWFESYNNINRSNLVSLTVNGQIDNSFGFANGSGIDAVVLDMLIQPDDKIILTGRFNAIGNNSAKKIVRLTADGDLDNSFATGLGANDEITRALLLPDGKIMIFGKFTTYNAMSCHGIARLNANGSFDTTFNNTGAGFDQIPQIRDVALLPDGKILISGYFYTTYNGESVSNFFRINADGSHDNSFNYQPPPVGSTVGVYRVLVRSDGKILASRYDPSGPSEDPYKICLLNNDGTSDNSFTPIPGTRDTEGEMRFLSDGKILYANWQPGSFNFKVMRYNSNGTVDAAYNTATNVGGFAIAMAVQPDDKCLLITASEGAYKLFRLNSDGTPDNTVVATAGFDQYCSSMRLQSTGKIIAAGGFLSYDNIGRNRIARLLNDGNLDVKKNDLPTNKVFAYTENSRVTIVSEATLLGEVTIYDLSGRKISEQKHINAQTVSFEKNRFPHGIAVAKILLNDQSVVFKKIAF